MHVWTRTGFIYSVVAPARTMSPALAADSEVALPRLGIYETSPAHASKRDAQNQSAVAGLIRQVEHSHIAVIEDRPAGRGQRFEFMVHVSRVLQLHSGPGLRRR
jgi:hypothetical protein